VACRGFVSLARVSRVGPATPEAERRKFTTLANAEPRCQRLSPGAACDGSRQPGETKAEEGQRRRFGDLGIRLA
jgi:hypothetical protein